MEFTSAERKLIERALYKYRNLMQEMHAEASVLGLECRTELGSTASAVEVLLRKIEGCASPAEHSTKTFTVEAFVVFRRKQCWAVNRYSDNIFLSTLAEFHSEEEAKTFASDWNSRRAT